MKFEMCLQAIAETRHRSWAARLLVIGAIVLLSGWAGAAAEPSKRLAVLELFTSQGCSSCPPADMLLNELSKRDNILALSFPVSYWDHLGWKDTLASDTFNKRQYDYAEARGDREIYTPQLVVNGVAHVVGSRPSAVEAAMTETAGMLEKSSVSVSMNKDGDLLRLSVGAAPQDGVYRSGQLWVACYNRSVDVAIGNGENAGRKVTYTNVVRELLPAGRWSGQEESLNVEIPDRNDFDSIAVLLQADKSGAIIGASFMPISD